MIQINENFLQLKKNYLFSEIGKKVEKYKTENPNSKIIKLGIGDITLPITPTVIKAMNKAVQEMGNPDTFKGYGSEQGYEFLREKIVKEYQERNVFLESSEIFISDGAKCDTGNIGDILGKENVVGITDPVYPVYLDTNIIAGRQIEFLPVREENDFIPELPKKKLDMIYLCYPNNPTGTVLTKIELKKWVDYALENHSLLLFDAAYEAFISEKEIPHSIYEIERAKECAIEFKSFSKTAGFTGIRCAYTIVPEELVGYTKTKEKVFLNSLWHRRQCTKFNGVSYITQKAAEAVYTKEGQKEIRQNIQYYLDNAKIINENLTKAGFTVYGGVNSPYVWLKVPKQYTSWQFFDKLLEEKQIIGTPGSGFGIYGEGYFRLSAFCAKENAIEAMKRFV